MNVDYACKYVFGINMAAKIVPAVVDAGVDILKHPVQTPIKLASTIVEEVMGEFVDIKI